MSSSFNINEILICLKNTYSSSDKNIRVQSEQKLSILKDLNIVTFTSKLIDLLQSNSNEINKDLKLSIILLLKRNIKEKIEKEELDKDSCNQLIQLYLTIIVDPNMTPKFLDNLNETFSNLIKITSVEILVEIINYINRQIYSMPLGSVNGVISILNAIISSPVLTRNYFLSILEGVLSMSISIVQYLYNEYEKINIENNFEDYLKINVMFMNIYELFFQCNFKSYKRFQLKNEKISNLYNDIFIIGAKLLVNLKAKDNNRIISWTGKEKIDKNINNMKIKILRFLNLQVNDLGQIIIDKNKIELHDQLIKIILYNLEWVIMNKYIYLIKLETESEKEDYSDNSYSLIISYMFIYLKRIFSKDNFIMDYTLHFNNMYKNILLPLLLISDMEEEIALDNDSVNGYCIDINDIIYDNKEKKIKSSLAGLIKIFYEKNINSNSFMIKYTVILLESMINNNFTNLENNKLFDDKSDIIILLKKAYSKEKIICALFLSLNILSDVSNPKNNYENILYLHDFFERNFDNLNNINYSPLKHQIIIFIRNYSLKFFEPDTNAFESTMNYLFNSLFDIKFSLISNTAADSIQYFFSIKGEDSNNIKYTLLKVATNHISDFEEQIKNTQISNFFDVLYQFLLNFENRDNEFFQKIFINICKRVHMEVERHFRLKFKVKKERSKVKKKAIEKTNLNGYEIIVNKSFNIIRMLMHNPRFVINNTPLIEEALAPLVSYMENPARIDFDEDIITIVYLIIINNKKITPLAFNLIKYLYKYCEKVGGLLLDLYMLINAYLAYGTEQILSNEDCFIGIISVFNSGIKGQKFKNSPFYTCILIQTWLINCTKLPNNNIDELISNIMKKINIIFVNYQNTESVGDELYSYLGYVTLILCGLINYSNIIIAQLRKYNNENLLNDWLQILIKENEAGFEYEIKIIIYSISIIIEKNIINGDIKFMQYLLNTSIQLLKCQENNAKFEYKKKTKKEMDLNNIEDDDDSDNLDEGDDTEGELIDFREIKDLINKTINPIKDIDEFKMFREILIFLKNNKSDIYSIWENGLNEQQRIDVHKLLATKRINIQTNKNNNVQIPRRIVTIKRTINNNNQ